MPPHSHKYRSHTTHNSHKYISHTPPHSHKYESVCIIIRYIILKIVYLRNVYKTSVESPCSYTSVVTPSFYFVVEAGARASGATDVSVPPRGVTGGHFADRNATGHQVFSGLHGGPSREFALKVPDETNSCKSQNKFLQQSKQILAAIKTNSCINQK